MNDYRRTHKIKADGKTHDVELPGETPKGYKISTGDRLLVQLYQSPVPYGAEVKRIEVRGREVSEMKTGEGGVLFCAVRFHANEARAVYPDKDDVVYTQAWIKERI